MAQPMWERFDEIELCAGCGTGMEVIFSRPANAEAEAVVAKSSGGLPGLNAFCSLACSNSEAGVAAIAAAYARWKAEGR